VARFRITDEIGGELPKEALGLAENWQGEIWINIKDSETSVFLRFEKDEGEDQWSLQYATTFPKDQSSEDLAFRTTVSPPQGPSLN